MLDFRRLRGKILSQLQPFPYLPLNFTFIYFDIKNAKLARIEYFVIQIYNPKYISAQMTVARHSLIFTISSDTFMKVETALCNDPVSAVQPMGFTLQRGLLCMGDLRCFTNLGDFMDTIATDVTKWWQIGCKIIIVKENGGCNKLKGGKL